MSQPILFYSKKNAECISLWKYLKNKNKLDTFVKICVDNNKKIPKTITSVPSVYIKGRPLINGKAIYMFLNSNITQTPSRSAPVFNGAARTAQTTNTDKKPEFTSSTNNLEGILDFSPIEMSGSFSDSYSFLQENPKPLDFCFEYIEKSPSL
tara:strand:+ start:8011 stop:8466 length:456 start_codon:yes stop_codon:yes gene_type:complete